MSIKTFFDALRLRSAAKNYARKLGPKLIHDYGASSKYNEAQIRMAVRKLNLPEPFIKLAFAVFMPEPDFIKLGGSAHSYVVLRDLYGRFVSRQASGEMGEAGAYSQSATLMSPNNS